MTTISATVKTLLIMVLAGISFSAHAKWGEKVPNRQYADFKRWHWGFSVGTHVPGV